MAENSTRKLIFLNAIMKGKLEIGNYEEDFPDAEEHLTSLAKAGFVIEESVSEDGRRIT